MKPILIAHRGNTQGPNPDLENEPTYLERAMNKGFCAEIDVWHLDTGFHLGHDFAQWPVSEGWLEHWQHRLLLHIKDPKALRIVATNHHHWHFFCHAEDRFTITSHGYIWIHDLAIQPDHRSMVPLITDGQLDEYTSWVHPQAPLFAVCTDYCEKASSMLDDRR